MLYEWYMALYVINYYILYLKYRMGEKHRIDVKGIKFTKSDTPSSLLTGTGISRGIIIIYIEEVVKIILLLLIFLKIGGNE